MKKLLVTSFFLIALAAYSQEYQDVVYLKNGSVIRGLITEQIPNESIKIESQGNIFVFKLDEIEKITKELTTKPRKEKEPKVREDSGLKKGYSGIAELAIGIAYGDDIEHANETVKVNLVNGFRFNPHFAIGVSTGARFLLRDDIYLVPIMADVRANVLNRKASPYFVLNIGTAYNGRESFSTFGTMFGFGVGVAMKVAPTKNTFNIGLSYEAIGASDRDYFMSDVWTGKYRSFGINMGLTF